MTQVVDGGGSPGEPAGPAPDRPPTGDRVAGWLLFVGQAVLAVVLTGVGWMWWSLVGLGCSDTPSEACEGVDAELLATVYAILPWVVLVATLVWMIVRIRRRLRLWWVPLAGGAVPVVVFVAGVALASQ